MKISESLFVIIFIVALSSKSFGQTIGVKAGLNLSKQVAKFEGNDVNDIKIKAGFHIGAITEFQLTEIFSFEPGLLLSTKGFKIDYEINDLNGKANYKNRLNLLYIDIPLTSKASIPIEEDVILFGSFGPYFSLGLSGKTKIESTFLDNTEIEERNIKWGPTKENHDFKRLDVGLILGVGVEIKTIQFGLSYGLGLANIATNTDGGNKIKNRVLSISTGYKFGSI